MLVVADGMQFAAAAGGSKGNYTRHLAATTYGYSSQWYSIDVDMLRVLAGGGYEPLTGAKKRDESAAAAAAAV